MTRCKYCTTESPMGKKNFKFSNWCKTCSTWKSKVVFCDCCKQRLRYKARRTQANLKHERM